MVADQLKRRGITDDRVLSAMAKVAREDFVPSEERPGAYDDHPLSIGFGVTISQPYIVALMSQSLQLRGDEHVLEVGTGSGYAGAVLAELAATVVTVETIAPLAELARQRLAAYGERVTVVEGDGSSGYPAAAPYDAISVTAAAPEIPPPLLEQLADGGRLVIPVGRVVEDLVLVRRVGATFEREVVTKVRFVPLTGEHGV